MKIVLTENAEKSYFEITRKYSENKANIFAKSTLEVIDSIQQNCHIGSKYKNSSYRKFLLSKQVYLFYKIENQIIYILLFWDNKRNPSDLDVILSS